MKVRIKREQLKKWEIGFTQANFWKKEDFFILPEEFELEISESDIVKEKTNREKWGDIFFSNDYDRDQKASICDRVGLDATQAYEKIVEGK